ncbi:MAG: type II toxin-antitoxin system RelE family toxin [Vulcanimicrobiaceae bacterium]
MRSRVVEYTRAARRDLKNVPPNAARMLVAALDAFAAGGESDIKKLRGYPLPRWRLRAGNYRAIFDLQPERVLVERIGYRRDIYR